MLSYLIFMLAAVIVGVKSEYNCTERSPNCRHEDPFPEEVLQAHRESGNLLPSNEFFVETCRPLTGNLECVRNHFRECPSSDLGANVEVLVDNVVEFCDEDSEFRKTYVANVGCLNTLHHGIQDCLLSFMNTVMLMYHVELDVLNERDVVKECVGFHALKPCVVSLAEESCGEDAAAAVTDFMRRLNASFDCGDEDTDFLEQILAELQSKLEEETEELLDTNKV